MKPRVQLSSRISKTVIIITMTNIDGRANNQKTQIAISYSPCYIQTKRLAGEFVVRVWKCVDLGQVLGNLEVSYTPKD